MLIFHLMVIKILIMIILVMRMPYLTANVITVFKMDLTEREAILLEKVAAKANETSTYGCMPRMYVEECEEED